MLVVPECSESPAVAAEPGVSFAWKGRYPRKGLGVFGFGGWRLDWVDSAIELPWLLPLGIRDPAGERVALLLAIWTVANADSGWPGYARQVAEAIDAWSTEIAAGAVVFAGDTNCSFQGPSSAAHAANVRRLEALGMRSAYHTHQRVAHGEEVEMTLRWFGRGGHPSLYHRDYVLLSQPLLGQIQHVEVGSHAEWIESGLSDHAPVTVQVAHSGRRGQ